MSTPGIITTPQIAGPSIDQNVESIQQTRPDTVLVQRQTVAIPDKVTVASDILTQILIELRVHSLLLTETLRGSTNLPSLDRLREDTEQDFASLN